MIGGYSRSPRHSLTLRKRPLLPPPKTPLNAPVKAQLDAVNVLHIGEVIQVAGHNLAQLQLLIVGELVNQPFPFV